MFGLLPLYCCRCYFLFVLSLVSLPILVIIVIRTFFLLLLVQAAAAASLAKDAAGAGLTCEQPGRPLFRRSVKAYKRNVIVILYVQHIYIYICVCVYIYI